jgi:CheY-like chemotaxis protein
MADDLSISPAVSLLPFRRSMNFIARSRFVAGVSILSLAMPLGAQDAETPPEARDAAMPVEVEDEPKAAASEQTVRFWVGQANQGPIEAGQAIAAMSRLNRFEVASQLLKKIDVAKLTPNEVASLAQTIDPSVRLRLLSSNEFKAADRQTLKLLLEKMDASASDPAALKQAIQSIVDAKAKAQGMRRLVGAGDAGTAAIVNHLVQNPSATSDIDLLKVAYQIDDEFEDALRHIALYGEGDVQARARELLVRLSRSKRANQPSIDKGVQDHTGHATSAFTDEVFELYRDNLSRVEDLDETVTVWVMNSDRRGVSPIRTRKILADYRRVVDIAAIRVTQSESVSPAILRDYLVSDLAYRVMIDSDWGDRKEYDSVLSAHPIANDVDQTAMALQEAVDRDDHPAMLGLVRLMQDQVTGKPMASTSPQWTNAVVAAAMSGVPKIRYEAALLVDRHFSGSSYAGQTSVRRTLREMRSLQDRPKVLLVETRPDIAHPIQTMLNSGGYEVETVSSVAQLLRSIDLGGDIRMIVSKRQLADRVPVEMVDLVRRITTMRHVPIVFFNEPAIDDELGFYSSTQPAESPMLPIVDSRYADITVQIDFPKSMLAFEPVFRAQSARQRISGLSAADRRYFADAATPR